MLLTLKEVLILPALITHYLHARIIFDNSDVQSLNKKAFLLGAQGPDFLYYHRAAPLLMRGKPLRSLGVQMHAIKPDLLFSKFAQYCTLHKADNVARSHAAGFLCHFLLDADAHPYVYAKQARIIEDEHIKHLKSCVHFRVEHALDAIMLERIDKMSPAEFDYSAAVTDDEQALIGCAKAAAYVINSLMSAHVTPPQLIQGYRDLLLVQQLTCDGSGIKHTLVSGVERIALCPRTFSSFVRTKRTDNAQDYANFSHRLWQNPYDKHDVGNVCDFAQLLNNSCESSAKIILQYCNQLSNGETDIVCTGNRSTKTGLKM